MKPMYRAVAVVVLVACVLCSGGVMADAAVRLEPETAAAGASVDLRFTITNDRSEVVTTRVQAVFPRNANVTQATAGVLERWSASQDSYDDDTVKSFTWSNGSLAPGQSQTFVVTATLPTTVASIDFSVLQAYADGSVVRYPDESADPMPSIAITGASTTTTSPLSTSTTATTLAPAATKEGNGKKYGGYLIGFGMVAGLFAYFRAKALNGPRR